MDLSVGYFWELYENGIVLAQSGETSGYASQILIDRDSGTAVIVLSNYSNDKYGSVDDIAWALLNEFRVQ